MMDCDPWPKAEGTEEDPVAKGKADCAWFLTKLQRHFTYGRRIWSKTSWARRAEFYLLACLPTSKGMWAGLWAAQITYQGFPWSAIFICIYDVTWTVYFMPLGVVRCTNPNKELGEETEFCCKSCWSCSSDLPARNTRSMKRPLGSKWFFLILITLTFDEPWINGNGKMSHVDWFPISKRTKRFDRHSVW